METSFKKAFKLKFWGSTKPPTDDLLKQLLQIVMASVWIYIATLGWFSGWILFLYIAFSSRTWPLAIGYLLWSFKGWNECHTGGKKSYWFRSLKCWTYYAEYFPLKVVKTADLPPDRNYLLCYHPHGVFVAGVFGHFVTGGTEFSERFPNLNVFPTTLSVMFKSPFFRDLLLGLGVVVASKESVKNIISDSKTGNAMVIAVGGVAEMLHARPGDYTIVLKKRKGFIKQALITGASLVPMYSFGENDIFNQFSNAPGSVLFKFQNFVRKYVEMPPVLFYGRGIFQSNFGFLPHRRSIVTVVGEPIDVQKTTNPSEELIEEVHQKYINKLSELFENYKHKYVVNPDKVQLGFV